MTKSLYATAISNYAIDILSHCLVHKFDLGTCHFVYNHNTAVMACLLFANKISNLLRAQSTLNLSVKSVV